MAGDKLTQPLGNDIVVDAPTTTEVVRTAIVSEILASNRTEDGRLKLRPGSSTVPRLPLFRSSGR